MAIHAFAKPEISLGTPKDEVTLSEWAKLSNLSLNLKKFCEIIIHNNYNKITPLVFIHLSNELLLSLSRESHSLKLSTSHLTLTILLINATKRFMRFK